MTRAVGLVLAAALLAGCSGPSGAMGGASGQASAPVLRSAPNPANVPGYVSPCAGGQPSMQYNCASSRN